MTRLFELLNYLSLIKYAKFTRLRESRSRIFVNCLRIKSIDRFNDKESSLFVRESIKSTNKLLLLCWRLNLISYVFLLKIVEHRHSLDLFLQTNLIMSKRSFIEERFKEFRSRFSQISETDSSKSSSATSFIIEDAELFAETIISFAFYEIWKAWSEVLDKETDRLY